MTKELKAKYISLFREKGKMKIYPMTGDTYYTISEDGHINVQICIKWGYMPHLRRILGKTFTGVTSDMYGRTEYAIFTRRYDCLVKRLFL